MDTVLRRPTKKKWGLWAAILIPACATLLLVGLTVARYVVSTHENAPAVAAEFFFTSDKLTASGDAHTIIWWDTSVPLGIDFQVKNAKDGLNVTGEPVNYALSVMNDPPVVGCDYPTQIQTLAPEADAAPDTALANDHTVTLTKAGDLPGEFTVTVKAAASSPYTAEIYAVYTVLVAQGSIASAVTDAGGRLAAEWTISVPPASEEDDLLPVRLHWPAGVMPDPSSPVWGGYIPTGDSALAWLPTGGIHRVLFYKSDPAADFSGSDEFIYTLN